AYLVDEVLSQVSDVERDLLLAASVCGEISGDLARVLSGRTDADAILDRLAPQSILVTRVDDTPPAYRVHRLVRSYLLADLTRRWPARAADLQSRAADWFARRQRPRQALEHAIQAEDAGLLARMLHRQALVLSLAGERDVL